MLKNRKKFTVKVEAFNFQKLVEIKNFFTQQMISPQQSEQTFPLVVGRSKVSYSYGSLRQMPYTEPSIYTNELAQIFSSVKIALENINANQKSTTESLAQRINIVEEQVHKKITELEKKNKELTEKVAMDRKLFENYSIAVSSEFAKLEKRLEQVERKK